MIVSADLSVYVIVSIVQSAVDYSVRVKALNGESVVVIASIGYSVVANSSVCYSVSAIELAGYDVVYVVEKLGYQNEI